MKIGNFLISWVTIIFLENVLKFKYLETGWFRAADLPDASQFGIQLTQFTFSSKWITFFLCVSRVPSRGPELLKIAPFTLTTDIGRTCEQFTWFSPTAPDTFLPFYGWPLEWSLRGFFLPRKINPLDLFVRTVVIIGACEIRPTALENLHVLPDSWLMCISF
jgi:hypothetical protein